MSEKQNDGTQAGESGEESLSSAVRNLVEEAVIEAEAAAGEGSQAFTIEVEEEPAVVRRIPLQNTAESAVGTVKNAAGTAASTSKSVAGSAVSGGLFVTGKLIELAEAALDFVQEENVIDRTAGFLDEAEREGKRLVNGLTSFLNDIRVR